MSPDEQRIAIAEACGWKVRRNEIGRMIVMREVAPNEWHIIDPLNDLNAMHEAEKMITDWWSYSDWLQKIADTGASYDRDLIQATAAQRAEAFLRTIGKWKDTK